MFFNRHKKIKISYGITVCNEAAELKALLTTLIPLINKNDEIIILQDVTKKNAQTSDVINNYKTQVSTIEAKLNNDFASFKNLLISKASGDFLFQLDADEIPKASLIKKIKKILYKRKEFDCFLVPRINIVNGLTAAHLEKWKWKLDDKNRVNFPDYQFRIFKLNGAIKWQYKVHEELYGFKRCFYFPVKNENLCLIHIKNIEKQTIQNQFYESIQK
jgi:glycosyltransferase involved in cell wall biosynthesis